MPDDPVISELNALRAEEERELHYAERLQDYDQQPDDFTNAMRMWAIVISVGLALSAIGFALLLEWMGV